jgi:hypothetical protein
MASPAIGRGRRSTDLAIDTPERFFADGLELLRSTRDLVSLPIAQAS